MIPRRFLIIAAAGFVLVVLAWSPFFSRRLGEPLVIGIDPATSSPTFAPTTASPLSPANVTVTSTSTGAYFTLTGLAICRNGPGIGYPVVATLPSGETVQVIGRTADQSWWRVSTDAAENCWIADLSGTFFGQALFIPITSSRDATQAVILLSPTRARQTALAGVTTALASTTSTNTTASPVNTTGRATSTPRPATSTIRPTSTLRSPTNTPRPPTSTIRPATSMPRPPMDTARPATSTPRPPTSTLPPATNTPLPPTDPPPTEPPPTEPPEEEPTPETP